MMQINLPVCLALSVAQTVWRGVFIEGSLEIKRPTIWTDGIAEAGRVREEKKKKREDQRGERVRRKKMQVREKIGKSRFTVFVQ